MKMKPKPKPAPQQDLGQVAGANGSAKSTEAGDATAATGAAKGAATGAAGPSAVLEAVAAAAVAGAPNPLFADEAWPYLLWHCLHPGRINLPVSRDAIPRQNKLKSWTAYNLSGCTVLPVLLHYPQYPRDQPPRVQFVRQHSRHSRHRLQENQNAFHSLGVSVGEYRFLSKED